MWRCLYSRAGNRSHRHSYDQFATDESYAATVDGMITIEVIFERVTESMVCKSKLLSKDVEYIGGAKQ